jgi:hypothetical protein
MSNLARSLALLLLLAPGCDTMTKTPPKATNVEEARTNASGDRSGLAGCLHDCSEQKLSATDEATCRNNCEQAFKVAPSAEEPPLDAAASCMHKCHAGGDAAACSNTCKQTAIKAGEAADVLDRLGACVDACEGDKGLSATDRWTCVRNCGPAAKAAPLPAPPT